MLLLFEHSENSEIYCTTDGVFILKRATISFLAQIPNEVVNTNSVARLRCSKGSGSVCMCKVESLTIIRNHNPKCNISSSYDISVNLHRNNAL